MVENAGDAMDANMTSPLPVFKYHLDPVASGVVIKSDVVCMGCGKARGHIYVGPAFTTNKEVGNKICPWCIADGSAAKQFDVEFSDGHWLAKAGLAWGILYEVLQRTPGYICWQSDHWQTHCHDACVFHGDATIEDVANASRSTINAWKDDYNQTDEDWRRLSEGYRPGGHCCFYKFVCRRCGEIRLSWDLD